MPSIISRSFAGGIIGPELAGRADQSKYQTGLKDALNVIIQRYGGVTNRPGTKYLGTTIKDAESPARLIRFIFNAEQTYVLEFGDYYIRVYRNGAGVAISPIPDPWSAVVNYVPGNFSRIPGGNYVCVTANVNDSPPSANWMSTRGIYTILSPYAAADLRGIQYVQSGDVLTLVHPLYAPRELRRTGHSAWTLATKSFVPGVNRPASCAGAVGAAGANTYRYQITAFDKTTLEESYAGRETKTVIGGATQSATPIVVTVTGHPYSTGDEVYVEFPLTPQLNGKAYVITKTDANHFSLDGSSSAGFTINTNGNEYASRAFVRLDSCAAPTASAPIVVSAVNPGAGFGLWIYRWKDGVYEWIGEASGNVSSARISFSDTNIAGQPHLTPPIEQDWFNATGFYPSTVTYVQQRLALANSADDPERIWLSQVGNFSNFARSAPIQDDDAIEFQLAGRQVNAVRHLIEIGGRMVVLTDSAEWTVAGDADGVVRPGAINPRQQGYDGSAVIAPVLIGNTALYVQARGSLLRDLRYEFESDGYQGRDLTIFAPHLFDRKTVVAIDYQKIPHSVAWLVLSDGTMLGLTYVKEHDVWGWHRHETAGGTDTIEDVCCVPEGSEDAVYMVVRRTVNGLATRFVERMASRAFTSISTDAFFVDCGLTYDGRNTTYTITLDTGTTWDQTDSIRCTVNGTFTGLSGMSVGDEVVITSTNGEAYRCAIISWGTLGRAQVRPDRLLPADLRGGATMAWAKAVKQLAGLAHLEGRTVTALCDGSVNPSMVVASGSVTLAAPAIIAHVGLPYTSRVETLDAENLNGETWSDKKRKIHAVSVRVKDSRGMWIGYGDGQLFEHIDANAPNFDDPAPLFSGLVTENVDTAWERSGKVVIEQRDPLPMTILSIIPVGTIGGRG